MTACTLLLYISAIRKGCAGYRTICHADARADGRRHVPRRGLNCRNNSNARESTRLLLPTKSKRLKAQASRYCEFTLGANLIISAAFCLFAHRCAIETQLAVYCACPMSTSEYVADVEEGALTTICVPPYTSACTARQACSSYSSTRTLRMPAAWWTSPSIRTAAACAVIAMGSS